MHSEQHHLCHQQLKLVRHFKVGYVNISDKHQAQLPLDGDLIYLLEHLRETNDDGDIHMGMIIKEICYHL
jgi:hypothetical protein